ncbi:65-kDa microtubule-associated protein 6 [Dendrobium catenatum]|uniref:65-kDa microtubule-associated protein 7 n=1 Tax=Dendrobium catenatum TaxID=906689 RepID=A0A2I0WGA7_9ASPA|nr:65-kDa microtubule-associated protein 6 [Dendrobium catenatum]PKU74695.1 65-kDa microtubule-associated protein 7 [Dendrobium catenatum]
MVAGGVDEKSLISFIMENSCGVLLRELQNIWAEIGESKPDQDKILLEIENECLQLYQRKVDEATCSKARLYQLVAAKEAELAALMASLGEQTPYSQAEKRVSSLKEKLAAITPLLEDLKVRKEERIKQFVDVQLKIEKITAEITENGRNSNVACEEQDLSTRKLNEYQTQLHTLQKEKSDRLQKVLDYTNEVHSLCGVLGLEFRKIVAEVHPSLRETSSEEYTNISTKTLNGLFQAVIKLKEERKTRTYKLRETLKSLLELWKLMDSSENEKHHFGKVTCILDSPYGEITEPGLLSLDIIKQIETEVERLTELKASRMKDLVLKRRLELEEVCRRAHIEPDMSTAPEKTTALIDSGLVDPTELVANIEAQIMKAREESVGRKEIIDRINRWLFACEEENWLEEYSQDENRYSAGKGAHLNLKRAEKARVIVNKIPAIVDNLILKTFAWEDQKNMPFLYDGVRLISILEEYRLTRKQKEAAKRQYKDRKKLYGPLEKESVYGSKPSSRRSNSLNSEMTGYHMDVNGFMTQTPRKLTVGCATPKLLSPRSYSSRRNRYFRDIRRLSSTHLNFVNLPREDTSSSFASISGSEPESSSLG